MKSKKNDIFIRYPTANDSNFSSTVRAFLNLIVPCGSSFIALQNSVYMLGYSTYLKRLKMEKKCGDSSDAVIKLSPFANLPYITSMAVDA